MVHMSCQSLRASRQNPKKATSSGCMQACCEVERPQTQADTTELYDNRHHQKHNQSNDSGASKSQNERSCVPAWKDNDLARGRSPLDCLFHVHAD